MDNDFFAAPPDSEEIAPPETPRREYHVNPYFLAFVIVLAGITWVAGVAKLRASAEKKLGAVLGTQSETKEAISRPDFTLNNTSYSPEMLTEIANFEKGEAWQGNGTYDSKTYYQGETSLSLVSINHSAARVYFEKNLDLSKAEFIELELHLTDSDSFESMYLDFSDSNVENFYSYSFTSLHDGWNLLQIPLDKFNLKRNTGADFGWDKIKKIQFTLIARPNSTALIRLDMLRAVNDSQIYLKDWQVKKGQEKILSLINVDDKTKLIARESGIQVATLKQLSSQDNFVFSSQVCLQTGRSGLFFGDHNTGYGYYFVIFSNSNKWQIQKRSQTGWLKEKETPEGELQNTLFTPDKNWSLMVEKRGGTMLFYFSRDGKTYEKLGEFSDSEFQSGNVGIAALGGWTIFDDFAFKEL